MRVERLTPEQYFDTNRKVKDFTDGGKCSKCGGCCNDLLYLSDTEIKDIKSYIKKHNIKEHTCSNVEQNALDFTCPFLNDEGTCNIYSVRPKICRMFLCSKSEDVIERNQKMFKARFTLRSMRDTFFTGESL